MYISKKKWLVMIGSMCLALRLPLQVAAKTPFKSWDELTQEEKTYFPYDEAYNYEIPSEVAVGETGFVTFGELKERDVPMNADYYLMVMYNLDESEEQGEASKHLVFYDDYSYEALKPGKVYVMCFYKYTEESVKAYEDIYGDDWDGRPDIWLYGKTVRIYGPDETIYRLYNPNTGEHFYTANVEEYDYLGSIGWNKENGAWIAAGQYKTDYPVYRLYNPNSGEHFYTINLNERDSLVDIGWSYEGIAFFDSREESKPIYRLYNPNATGAQEAGAHHYTSDANEVEELVRLGWKSEGIGWYGK